MLRTPLFVISAMSPVYHKPDLEFAFAFPAVQLRIGKLDVDPALAIYVSCLCRLLAYFNDKMRRVPIRALSLFYSHC